jgi:hypothetical protein
MNEGVFIGYDIANIPRAVAVFGKDLQTSRDEAYSLASEGGLHLREFKRGDPELAAEMDRFAANI